MPLRLIDFVPALLVTVAVALRFPLLFGANA
jgi:hypothetical protein